MKYTKSQQMMIDDGLPAAAIMTQQERAAVWVSNPPRTTMWKRNQGDEMTNFASMTAAALRQAYGKLAKEAVDLGLAEAVKTYDRKIGLQQCEELYKAIKEAKAGTDLVEPDEVEPTHQMNNTDMSLMEVKPKPTKKKAAPPPAAKPAAAAAAPAGKKPSKKPVKKATEKKAPAKEPQHPITVALGLRSNSLMEKIALFLGTEGRLGKMVLEKIIVKHLYGDERSTNRIEVLMKEMKKDKYELRKDVKDGVISYGLYAKK